MTQLGFSCARAEANELFASWDADGSGQVDYREMNRLLRRGATVELDAALQVGARGEIEVHSKNAHSLRKDGPQSTHSRLLGGEALDLESEVSLTEQLASALDTSKSRVNDLFAEWDKVCWSRSPTPAHPGRRPTRPLPCKISSALAKPAPHCTARVWRVGAMRYWRASAAVAAAAHRPAL